MSGQAPPGFSAGASMLPDVPGLSAPITVMRGGGQKGGFTSDEIATLTKYELHDKGVIVDIIDAETKKLFLEQLPNCKWGSGNGAILNSNCSAVASVLKALFNANFVKANGMNIPKPIDENNTESVNTEERNNNDDSITSEEKDKIEDELNRLLPETKRGLSNGLNNIRSRARAKNPRGSLTSKFEAEKAEKARKAKEAEEAEEDKKDRKALSNADSAFSNALNKWKTRKSRNGVEYNVKNYLFNTLQSCHKTKTNMYLVLLNIMVMVFFICIVAITLYYCYKKKKTPEELAQKIMQDQEFILSKIKFYQTYNLDKPETITNLPAFNPY